MNFNLETTIVVEGDAHTVSFTLVLTHRKKKDVKEKNTPQNTSGKRDRREVRTSDR